MATTPTTEPASITAGDTLTWQKTLADYPATVWTLKYRFINATAKVDITATASILSRQMGSPTARQWEQARRVLRYVSGTKDKYIAFTGTISTDLLIWQDSSFTDGIDRRSRTGFIAMMSGGPVS